MVDAKGSSAKRQGGRPKLNLEDDDDGDDDNGGNTVTL
jgi:hypothetical protein